MKLTVCTENDVVESMALKFPTWDLELNYAALYLYRVRCDKVSVMKIIIFQNAYCKHQNK